MFDNCKFKDEKCGYSNKGIRCGFPLGNNLIKSFKECPLVIAKKKLYKTKGNKKYYGH